MIERLPKRRVLIIGAGRRVQNNFLPALECLSESFEVCGIHSRTPATLNPVAERWLVPAIHALEAIDLSKIDTVAVSVPTSQNANVLRRLQAWAPGLDLVIDTPIAWNGVEQAETAPLLKQFRSVTVTEDYMNFPRFSLIRQVVRSGLIGELKRITLNNIGYLYHGLALLRSFVGFGPVLDAWSKRVGHNAVIVGYDFAEGFSATVVGPYRRHNSGGIVVEGTAGVISEFPFDQEAATAARPVYLVSRLTTDGMLSGFEIRGETQVFSLDMQAMRQMRRMPFTDQSDLNIERGCGLIEVFRSLIEPHNLNHGYRVEDAFYDGFVSRRAEAGETPLDPFNTFAQSGVGASLVAKVATFLKETPRNAADLAPQQKIAVVPGTRIEVASSGSLDNHLLLTGVKLNGEALENPSWFIYPPAWEFVGGDRSAP